MGYSVKEIYYTIQGEGAHTGRPAVFCRFSGCNLWSGRESDRQNAICTFCDTNFVGTDGLNGGKFNLPIDLANAVAKLWPKGRDNRFVVLTGGEPLLQLDRPLLDEFHFLNFEVAVETNGTIIPPEGIDWICVSPKAGAELNLKKGNELKLVYPQDSLQPAIFEELVFNHFYLQPMDGPKLTDNIRQTLEYCLRNPKWKLSLQTHKMLNIP